MAIRARVVQAIVGALLTGGIHAASATTVDVTAGHVLAKQLCSSCHDVGDGPPSLLLFAGPSFARIVANPVYTELALRVFHQTMKEEMPTFVMTPREMDELVAYMLSLRAR